MPHSVHGLSPMVAGISISKAKAARRAGSRRLAPYVDMSGRAVGRVAASRIRPRMHSDHPCHGTTSKSMPA
eukprot:14073654-Heterocapsa_arctica.AAC.1